MTVEKSDPMRKLVAYELVSLDGGAEDPDAFITEFDEVMQDNLARVIASQDAVLLGRRTYEEWAAFWPGSGIQPFSDFINAARKYVTTSHPLTPAWNNAVAIEGALSPFIRQLKKQEGGDIGVHGSLELLGSLLRDDLVDEFRMVVAPAFHQEGRRLLECAPSGRLHLTRSVTSPAGYLLLDYSRDSA